jgi:hypothetical protein
MWRWRTRTDEDFREEIHANIALDTDRFVAEGLNRREASAAAHRAFGNVAQVQERFYESRRILWLDDLRRDLRLAWRSLGKNRGFTLAAVVTLALGIGANTAIFSLINTVMLRPLPVRQPEQLVELLSKFPGDPRLNLYSWTDYLYLRDENHVFSDLLAISRGRHQVTGDRLTPEVVDCMYVGGNFFDVPSSRGSSRAYRSNRPRLKCEYWIARVSSGALRGPGMRAGVRFRSRSRPPRRASPCSRRICKTASAVRCSWRWRRWACCC